MVSVEILDKAIQQIENMIQVMVKDISIGASYTRVNSTACLDMINLKKELEDRRAAIAPKKAKAK